MKTQGRDIHAKRGRTHTKNDVTDLAIGPPLDQEAIARLAYFYWEARGCGNDSSDDDWFRAEAELHRCALERDEEARSGL